MKRFVVIVGVVVSSAAFAGILNTIGCPDCGQTVSVRAFMCPKCGCCKEAITQQVKAADALSRLSKHDRDEVSGTGNFAQVGRIIWMQEERIVRNVMTNETAAISAYTAPQQQAAKEASAKIKRILSLGFTMDQIFVMRYDLIGAALGNRKKPPLEY